MQPKIQNKPQKAIQSFSPLNHDNNIEESPHSSQIQSNFFSSFQNILLRTALMQIKHMGEQCNVQILPIYKYILNGVSIQRPKGVMVCSQVYNKIDQFYRI